MTRIFPASTEFAGVRITRHSDLLRHVRALELTEPAAVTEAEAVVIALEAAAPNRRPLPKPAAEPALKDYLAADGPEATAQWIRESLPTTAQAQHRDLHARYTRAAVEQFNAAIVDAWATTWHPAAQARLVEAIRYVRETGIRPDREVLPPEYYVGLTATARKRYDDETKVRADLDALESIGRTLAGNPPAGLIPSYTGHLTPWADPNPQERAAYSNNDKLQRFGVPRERELWCIADTGWTPSLIGSNDEYVRRLQARQTEPQRDDQLAGIGTN